MRATVKRRDGYCRLQDGPLGACRGRSEWAHLRGRWATRNLPPEERHNARTSVMLCTWHHQQLDGGVNVQRIKIGVVDQAAGADGAIWVVTGGRGYAEANDGYWRRHDRADEGNV